MAEIAETVVIAVLSGLGTGVVGVFALALQNRYTENTQQISQTLVEMESMIDQCVGHAGRAWSAEGNPDSDDVAETVCTLHDIGSLSRFVTDRVNNSGLRLNSALVNFRNQVSGDDFDVRDRPANKARILDIRSSASSLKIACREVNYDRRRFFMPW